MATATSPPPEPRYPVWLGVTSFGWAVVGWVLAASAPRLAFVPGIETLHLVLPSVTVLLILGNLAFSSCAFYFHKVAIDRLLLVTGLQIGLFTTLFFQFAAHIGAETYWIQRPTQSWEWVQFSIAHAIRATDVLDTVEAFGWSIQVIKHRSPFVAAFVVAYHVVIDLFMLGLFWAVLDRIKKRYMEDPGRARRIRNLGIFLFLVWLVSWLLCVLWLRPWRPFDVPLWLGENFLRVLDFADAMDAFDIHWHQVPKELPESALTFFYRFWIATGISLLLEWRVARNKVRPLPVPQHPPVVGRLSWLGIAAVLLAALIGTDLLVASAQSERCTELASVASGADTESAERALAAIRRLGPNADSAIEPLVETQSRLPERQEAIVETLGYLGPNAIEPLRRIARDAHAPSVELAAVASLHQIGPRAAPALAAVWSETKTDGVKSAADAGLREFGLDAMPHLIQTTDKANSAAHCHWFNELDRNWTLRGTDNGTVLAFKQLQGTRGLPRELWHKRYPDWVRASGSAAVPFLVRDLWYHVGTRQTACYLLGDIGPNAKEAVPELCRVLADEAVHGAAVHALDRIDAKWHESAGARQAVPALAKVLDAKEGHIRRTAIEALHRFGPSAKEAVPALVKALTDDDVGVQKAAADALAKIDSKWYESEQARQAVPALVESLARNDVRVQIAAAESLAKIGPKAKEAVPTLITSLADQSGPVRGAAADALVKIDSKWYESEQAHQAVPALVESLARNDVRVQIAAAESLAKIGRKAKEAVPALIKFLVDQSGPVRGAAADALAKIDSKWYESEQARQAVPALVESLARNDVHVRIAAAEALVKIDPSAKEAVPALVKCLADGDWQLRRATAESLGKIGSNAKEAVPALVKALADMDSRVQVAAAETLGKISPSAKEAVPALVKALADYSGDVRRAADKALDKIDLKWYESEEARQAVPDLVKLLGYGFTVGTAAAEALGKIGSSAKEAVPVLVKARADREWAVRRAAAEALDKIDSKWYKSEKARQAVPDLVKCLAVNNWEVQSAAAETLGKLGPNAKEAVPALSKTLADKKVDVLRNANPNARAQKYAVVRAAAEALGNIGPSAKDALSALETLAKDDYSVPAQQAARKAIEQIRGKGAK